VAAKDRRLPAPRWWLLGGVAFVAVVAPWLILIAREQGREFLLELLVRQTFDRFLGHGDSKGTIVHYLGTVPADMLPWTLFAPLAALHARRARSTDPAAWGKLRFLLVGAGVELAFLSLSACRINKYALPVFPQLALCLGAALDAEGTELDRRLVAHPARALAVLLGVAALGAPFVVASKLPSLARVAFAGAVLALLGGAALHRVARRGRAPEVAFALAALLAATLTFVGAAVDPAVDEIRTDRPLEEAIVKHVSPGTPYATYGLATRSYIIFYTERTNRELYGRDDLGAWLASIAPREGYVLTRDDYVSQLASDPALAPRLEPVGRNPQGVGHDDYVLLRVRAR
jgi:4-amino-4-deoxy-L-arabinose transferase-like glycosyltransferase